LHETLDPYGLGFTTTELEDHGDGILILLTLYRCMEEKNKGNLDRQGTTITRRRRGRR